MTRASLRGLVPPYALAGGATALALLLTALMQRLAERSGYPLFFAAVMLSAWYGGLGPGLLASGLAAVATDYFLLPPTHSLWTGVDDALRLSVFLAVALLITGLTAARRRAAAAQARVHAENRFHELLETAPDPIVTVNAHGVIVVVNAQVETLFGYRRAELIGQPVETLLPERLRALHAHHRADYAARPHTRPMGAGLALWARRKDGSEFPVEIHLSPLDTPEGLVVTSVIRDVTERQRTEAALAASEQRFRGLFEQSGLAMAMQALDGRYLRVNQALCDMLGYLPDELLALGYQAITHPDDAAADREADRRRLAGETAVYQREKRYRHQRGHFVWVLVSVSLIRDPEGRPEYFLAQCQDVSERKAFEDVLRQAQKMEAIGRLAGGVAHDFNNLLTVILGRSQVLLRRLEAGDPRRRHAELIEKTAGRAAALTQQLLAFGRKQMIRPRVLDLNAAVTGMVAMLRRLLGEDIEVESALAPDLGHVKVDPSQLEQVLLNLVINARDAMPHGGRLLIETANAAFDEAYVATHPGARPGASVMLAVTDTGVGIDAETQRRLFEPFFTTKTLGHGTGLGLATVYGIVKQSGGNIWVYSEPGQGTTFKIYLPRVEEPLDEAGVAGVASRGGRETILLVEDDDAVRGLGREILWGIGYMVLEARSPDEALEVSARHAGPIHLLLTDVVMPKMSGRALADRLVLQRPDVRVIYMSGYTDGAIVHHGVLAPGVVFIQKPFTPDRLAQTVRMTLDRPPRS